MNTVTETKTVADAAAEAIKAIAAAKEAANRDIAVSTAEAQRVLLTRADQTAKTLTVGGVNDHDFMLSFTAEFKTKLDFLIGQVAELKDNNAKRINDLEIEKLNCRDSYPVLYKKDVEEKLADHEKRIKVGEITDTRILAYGAALIVAMGILEFIIGKYL